MATEDIIFKFGDGYILLEDLECSYEKGYVTADDEIRVFQGNGSARYKIQTLIDLYGKEYPFRRKLGTFVKKSRRRPRRPVQPASTSTTQVEVVIESPRNFQKEKSESSIPSTSDSVASTGVIEDESTSSTNKPKETKKKSSKSSDGNTQNSQSSSVDTTKNAEFKRSIKELKIIFDRKPVNQLRNNKINGFCPACKLAGKTVKMKCEIDAFKHFVSDEHCEKVVNNAAEDLLYWKNWLNNAQGLDNPTEIKKSAQLVEPKKKNKKGIENDRRLVFKRSTNSPRIALLDAPTKQHELIPEEEYKNRHENLKSKLGSLNQKNLLNKPLICKCFHCPSSVSLKNTWEVMNHVFDGTHCSNVVYMANNSDFDWWEKLILEHLDDQANKSPALLLPQKISNRQSDNIRAALLKRPTNNPRVALLDVPKSEAEMLRKIVYKQRYGELKTVVDSLEPIGFFAQMNCKCSHCPSFGPFKNIWEVMKHVFDGKHCENIQFMANKCDFDFWEEVISKGKKEANKCPVDIQPPEVPPKKKKSVDKRTNILRRPQNSPRIALLDTPKAQNKMLSQKLFMTRYDNLKIKMGSLKPENWQQSMKCQCSHCPSSEPFNTVWEVMNHIFNDNHAKNILFMAEKLDFVYWENLISYANKTAAPQPAKPKFVDSRILRTQVLRRSTNSPRVALLDIPASQGSMLKKSNYKVCYEEVRRRVDLLTPEDLQKPMKCKCYHCPLSATFNTVLDVVKHVFDGKHCEEILYMGESKDFDYWTGILDEKVKVVKPIAQVSPVPTQCPIQVQQVKPIFAPIRISPPQQTIEKCSLPLFSVEKGFRGFEVVGPTLGDLQIIYKGSDHQLQSSYFTCFQTPTICQFCDVEMTGWSNIQVARHAFSLKHLHKISKTKTTFMDTEFQYWINKLGSTTVQSSYRQEFRLGFSRGRELTYLKTFKGFNIDEKQKIANFDFGNGAINDCLLQRFGGCVSCDQWLCITEELVRHYASDAHLQEVLFRQVLSEQDMKDFMKFMEMSQKEKPSKCLVM